MSSTHARREDDTGVWMPGGEDCWGHLGNCLPHLLVKFSDLSPPTSQQAQVELVAHHLNYNNLNSAFHMIALLSLENMHIFSFRSSLLHWGSFLTQWDALMSALFPDCHSSSVLFWIAGCAGAWSSQSPCFYCIYILSILYGTFASGTTREDATSS